MKRYDSDAKCPKCGSSDIGTQLCDYERYACRTIHERSDQEELHRDCRVCSYRWSELPLDAQEEKP